MFLGEYFEIANSIIKWACLSNINFYSLQSVLIAETYLNILRVKA